MNCRWSSNLVLAELGEGVLDAVLLGPFHEDLLIRHDDAHTACLEAVPVDVGLSHVAGPNIDVLYLLWSNIFTLRGWEGGRMADLHNDTAD